MTSRTSRRALLAAAGGALALAACTPAGQSGSDSGGGGGGNTGTGGGGGDGGGTIKYHLYQNPTNFNPMAAINGADAQICALQFKPLVFLEDNEFKPGLAEKFEPSADAKSFSFTLRDAKWSDGQPITAKDVVFTMECFLSKEVASSFSAPLKGITGAKDYADGKAQTISGITAEGDKKVVMKLDKPDAGFLVGLYPVHVIPQHVYGSLPKASYKGANEFREPKVGSGPYVFSRWVSNDSIEFKANPNFWSKPKLANVYTTFLKGDVAVAQLQTGELDIGQLPATDVDRYKQDGKFTVISVPGNQCLALHTAVKNGKLADKRLRQAVMYALDREGIIKSVLGGRGKPTNSYMFLPDWIIPSGWNEYKFDPNKAKQLLAEAGYKPDTVINLNIVPGQADRDAVYNIAVGQLKAAGFNAVIKPHQPADSTNLLKNNSFDLLVSPLTYSGDPGMYYGRLATDQAYPAGNNITGYSNPELDKLLADGAQVTDREKRKEIYQKANKLVNEECPVMPLYQADLNWGTTKKVKGFNPTALTYNAENWSAS